MPPKSDSADSIEMSDFEDVAERSPTSPAIISDRLWQITSSWEKKISNLKGIKS